MSRMDENLEELLTFYALGALTESERAQVEVYINSYPEAKRRLDEMIRTTSALPYAVESVDPSAALKKKLMDRVKADSRARFASPRQAPADSWSRLLDFFRPRAGNRLSNAVALLSLFIALGLGAWGLSLRNKMVSLQTEIASLRQELSVQRVVLAQVTSPQARTFAISGTEHQPQAHGQLIEDSKTGSVTFIVSDLKPLESGFIYEFWLIKDNTLVPAGLFKVDEHGQAILQVAQNVPPDSFNAIGVSIEPQGGSQQPTGDIVMLGKLN